MTVATPEAPPAPLPPRKPRKIFLVVGLVLAVVLGIGLFTSLGTNAKTGPPHRGGQVPSFTAARLNGAGSLQVPAEGGSDGTVLLFFGSWCPSCHGELPPLAAAVRNQGEEGGALAKVRVIGVDSEDTKSVGDAFISHSGVRFAVVRDPDLAITSGDFYFDGDPDAVFIKPDGTISAIVPGALSAARLTAEEKKLIPSGS
jgi:thiol-disulfide isomerase/thioredoxin